MTAKTPTPAGEAGAKADVDTIRKTVLANGVRVIVREMRTAPVVALNLWVGTGGVDDPDGREGVAHFIEHMLFKPDAATGADLAREVYDAGGYVNAMTGSDHTTYYQIVPSATWRSVLAAQAAVIAAPRFDPDEVMTERAVILEELRSGEASPETLVWRRLMATAFTTHPLRQPIVGTEAALEAMTADDLGRHFAAHYRGTNIVLVVVGDADAGEVFAEADRLLGELPAGGRPMYWDGTEPAQTELRALSVHGAVAQPYLSLAFHVPAALHEDIPALDALSGLLGQGRSSRLRRTLALEQGLVSDVSCGIAGYRDTGLLVVHASATTSDIGGVVAGVLREIRRLASDIPSAEEMEKNLRRLEAGYLLEHETPEAIAGGLGYFELLGDCRLAERYVDRLAEVTPDDVSRAADSYLGDDNLTLVIYGPPELGLPEGDISGMMADRVAAEKDGESIGDAAGDSGAAGTVTEALKEQSVAWSPSGFTRPMIISERRSPERRRETLPSGATLITSDSKNLPLTSIAIAFRGGHCDEDDVSSGSTYLAMRTASRGSLHRSGFELADEIESMGTSLATIVERDGFGVGSTCLSRLQSDAAALLGEVVLEPAFDPRQLEMARVEVEGEIGETEDHPFRRAVLNILPMIFPGHPYGRPLRGRREALAGLGSVMVRARYLRGLDASRLVVCASGSVDHAAMRTAAEQIASGTMESDRVQASGAMPSEFRTSDVAAPQPGSAQATSPVRSELLELEHGVPGQSQIALGLAGPHAAADDAVALRFLTRALSMMGGPLWTALRENPPHAYSVHASPLLLASGGAVLLSVTARPGDEEAAVDGLKGVLRAVRTEGLAAEELARAKSYVAGTMELAMQRESTRAASYTMSEILGVGFERLEDAPGLVRQLTNDDVVRVARRWLDPDAGLATVILKSG